MYLPHRLAGAVTHISSKQSDFQVHQVHQTSGRHTHFMQSDQIRDRGNKKNTGIGSWCFQQQQARAVGTGSRPGIDLAHHHIIHRFIPAVAQLHLPGKLIGILDTLPAISCSSTMTEGASWRSSQEAGAELPPLLACISLQWAPGLDNMHTGSKKLSCNI